MVNSHRGQVILESGSDSKVLTLKGLKHKFKIIDQTDYKNLHIYAFLFFSEGIITVDTILVFDENTLVFSNHMSGNSMLKYQLKVALILALYFLFRQGQHKNRESVLDWEITAPGWPTVGLYTHSLLKIPILHHTDISPDFVFTHSEQDIQKII